MTQIQHAPATWDDLRRTKARAELIGGRIVCLAPSGYRPNQVAANINASLRTHVRRARRGVACADNLCFAVPELPSGRESFSPDAAYFAGPAPDGPTRLIAGPPALAVEVRGESDYGTRAELEIAAKRDDYFAAGTEVVWDVDPVEEEIHVYRASNPDHPTLFERGQFADAEPAVPGWRVAVDEIFD